MAHHVRDLRHAGRFAVGRFFTGDLDAHGVFEVFFGDAGDAGRERSGKERRLHRFGHGVENGVELVGKAQIKHLVGFVENDRFECGEVERSLVDVVKCSAGRRDDDVRAAFQGSDLSTVLLSAVNGRDDDARITAEVVERFAHLQAEFACRREYEDQRKIGFGAYDVAVEQGKTERGGFARSGGGLTEDVASFE